MAYGFKLDAVATDFVGAAMNSNPHR